MLWRYPVTIEPLQNKGCDDVTIKSETLPNNSQITPSSTVSNGIEENKPIRQPYIVEPQQLKEGDLATYTGKKFKDLTGKEVLITGTTSIMALCKAEGFEEWIRLEFLKQVSWSVEPLGSVLDITPTVSC